MKKSTRIISIIFILLFILFTGIYVASDFFMKKSLINYWSEDEPNYIYHKYKVVKCNLNPIFPKAAIIIEQQFKDYENEFVVHFYDITNLFKMDKDGRVYTGGTTIKNTTFPQLVAMVKEDCSQFQGGFVNEDPDGIHWTHTRADTKEEKAESIRRVSYGKLKLFPEFIEVYGDIDEMTDDEVIALHEQIKEEGLDAKVQMADDANDLRKELLEITQEQRDQVKQTYGEWKDFTNEEFLEWIEIIKVDMESGKFVLIGK